MSRHTRTDPNDRMTPNDTWLLPIERHPDPVCSYEFEEGSAVIRDHNEPFGAITDLASGDRIDELFAGRFTVATPPSLDRNGTFWLDQPDRAVRYLVRVVSPAECQPGYLVFTEVDEDADTGQVGVDRVASVLSHDLRNPLDVAQARLQAGRELDNEEHFDHVEQAHERMERIIQDVLTLARGEDVVTPEETVDLETVVREAWRTVETNGATLQVPDDLPSATADRDRVTRLFENLFRNSVEHGSTSSRTKSDDSVEQGGGPTAEASITVTVGQLSDGLYIADDGSGIEAEDPDRIFEPGYSSDEHGTGLGLAIVARIADLHGWQIDVTHGCEGGARFEITGVE